MISKENRALVILLIISIILGLVSCKEDPPTPVGPDEGKMIVYFSHRVNGSDLETDIMKYSNKAGNQYLVTEVQYFISDLTFYYQGDSLLIDDWKDIHYIDTDIPSSWQWDVFDGIPAAQYDSIVFTFGISNAKNQSLMFVNPPERDMFWPEVLGGGYHYLKLNGKWKNEGMQNDRPFEFHLGKGQIYEGDTVNVEDIIGYIDNDFRVSLPGSSFAVSNGDKWEMEIVMNIENWFQNPFLYDFNEQPENTMQYQDAMQMGCINGRHDVFSLGYLRKITE